MPRERAPFEHVCVVGLGYIGLPTAALIASRGLRVTGVDINPRAVETINRGGVHIVEPELDVLVRAAVESGRLRAVTEPVAADVFLIAVPTPLDADHRPDLSCVHAAARAIAPVLRPGNLVILESTSPVGTTEALAGWLAEARPDLRAPRADAPGDYHLAYCPERVLPGRVIHELTANDRVIGGLDPDAAAQAAAFYGRFVQGRLLETDCRTAELVKLTENAFRDVNIAFANELSLICHRLGIDVWRLIELANHHPRVNILSPGAGVGGHCIAVDPWFIVDSTPEEARLIRTAREVNDGKTARVIDWIRARLQGRRAPVVACLGLAFKPDIDDLRESPALRIVETLAAEPDLRLLVWEPHITELPPTLQRANVERVEDGAALADADLVVALVRHSALRELLGRHPVPEERLLDVVNARALLEG